MSYRIALTNAAKRGLRHVNPELQRRIAARLQELKQTPRPSDEGDRLVTVLSIAHRREAYR